jgi:hypothetical protein
VRRTLKRDGGGVGVIDLSRGGLPREIARRAVMLTSMKIAADI